MSEPPGTTFAPERILKQAQGNGTGVTLGIIAYLKEHGQSPSGLFTSIGQRFAPTWEGMKGRGAKEVARGAALNMVSLGATLRSLGGDESEAEVVVEGWPPEESLQLFGLARFDADLVLGVFEPIAAYVGLHVQWQREGDVVKVTFSR
jgi:hypothetical protein